MHAPNHPAKRLLLLISVLALALGGSCGGKPKKSPKHGAEGVVTAEPGDEGTVLVDLENAPLGLALELSEGQRRNPQALQIKPAKAQKLSDAAAKNLLARLPALKENPNDKKDFALRERSLPPPRTGKTIKKPFPVPGKGAPPTPARTSRELEVLRYAPKGDVPIAPHLSVTFNHPMVAVTSHADSVKGGVPVVLSPQPAGRWRWLGTRTLLFDPKVRFPMATEYRVEIPKGTRSATGLELKKAVSFHFTTPAPTIKQSWPTYGPHVLDPVFFVLFDQKIDPAAVLKTVRVTGGKEILTVRQATEAEIEADESVSKLVEQAKKNEQSGRFVAFRVGRPLEKATHYAVEIGPGTPSAEGPRKTTSAQSFSFFTYNPLEVVDHRCSWGGNCPPQTPWSIRLNNPLDSDDFDPTTLRVKPELSHMRATVSGAWISIQGRSKARTTYRVTLPATLKDKFGQTLGDPKALDFHVGDANPQLFGRSGLVLLDPAAKKPTFDLHSVNIPSLDVEVYRVEPKDWDRFVRFMQRNPRKPRRPPGKRVFKGRIKAQKTKDEMVETRIDLGPALGKDGLGHAVVLVEPTSWPNRWKPRVQAWVESTHIGLDAFVDSTDLTAWATRLEDGRPLGGVDLEIVPFGTSRKTDEKGLAELPLSPAKGRKKTSHMLLGKKGGDVAFLPESTYWWSSGYGGWYRRELGESLRWFTYDDRQMYRPGEKVHVKGWIRKIDNGEGGDIDGLAGSVRRVQYQVIGPRGNQILKGKSEVSGLGGFDLAFELPKTPNLGRATLSMTAIGKGGVSGRVHNHVFQIQEFRRPEFEVTTRASEGPHLVGGSADVTVKAAYYAGGGLQNADVRWTVRSTPTTFVPPNRREFTFGTWTPWWQARARSAAGRSNVKTLQGKTDAGGEHVLHIDFLSARPPRPMSVVAQAYVTDLNRQTWAASSTLLVHPSEVYVGLKRDHYFVERGEPIELQTIVVDHDGNAVEGRAVKVRAARIDWKYENGEYKEIEVDPQDCNVTSKKDAIDCSFATPDGGTYRITATTRDEAGRPTQTQLLYWVTGGKTPPERNVKKQQVTLVPDKKEYRPGDTARILVQAPFYPAEGLLSVRRSGITKTRSFRIESSSTTLEVPIKERHVPNLYVQVDLVGSAERTDDAGEPNPKLPKRPAYAAGRLKLPVPPRGRTLQVAVKPRAAKIEPGGKTSLDIRVTDAAGKPVRGAEMSVVVVDESVLALSGYQTPDPIGAFYAERPPGATDYYARKYVQLARPDEATLTTTASRHGHATNKSAVMLDGAADDEAAAGEAAPAAPPSPAPEKSRQMERKLRAKDKGGVMGGVLGGKAAQNTPIAVRKDFGALAVFAPEVKTGKDGRARVPVVVPDNLTRYRVMVMAAAGDRDFGAGESNITARKPLMVRPSPPRFLNFGDVFELPIVVQNQTDEAMTVDLAVRAVNAGITDGSGRRVQVAANDRVEVRFPAASEMPGVARFQIGASAGSYTDASEISMPVWTPATTEAFATYGELDRGAVRQPVAVPSGVVEEFGGLEITTSSTQLQALTDAVLYLIHYPYECAEQTSSRVMAIAALRDVLSAFEARGMPSKRELERIIARDVKHLASLQNPDGGFAFWVRGRDSWPYISIHVAHALIRAKEKGYEVPAAMLQRSKRYLKQIERHIPAFYPPKVRRTLIAYSLYVRKRMGDLDIAKAKRVMHEAGLKGLSMEAIGWLLGTMTGNASSRSDLHSIRRYLQNHVTETAATAHFAGSYSDGAHLILHSDRRADGVILESLIEDRPKSDLIPKITRGLLAHRTRGHWQNTQENSFVLLAMDKYFQTYEKVTPSFMARAWLGDAFAGQQRFAGRETKRLHIDVPMSYLAKTGRKQDLVLQKKGKGRLYYRVGMTYAPRDLMLEPTDQGFAVERVYEAIDDPDDVKRLPDGTWKIRAGALVRVRLTMVAEARRYQVALVDPLPAGLEPLNPSLAVTGDIPQDPNQRKNAGPYWWWLRPWYEHQNMRDERVEAFTSLLWAGVHEYTYVARATTPGKFVVPPAKAEEMYFPETFGRTGSDRVVVE